MKSQNFPFGPQIQHLKRLWPVMILIILVSMKATGQTWLYFQDSPTAGYYDFSWMEKYPPSTLETTGSDNRRFPVESVIPARQGINALRLKWNSKPGGNWYAIAAGTDWTAKDITTADTLAFFMRSESTLQKELLPRVFFEDVNNTKSSFFPVSDHATDLQPGIWTRIKVPMNIFLTAGDPVDYSVIKTIGFTQDSADGQEHTVYIDDMRVFRGDGTSPPVSTPAGLTAKGYERHIFLTWTPNPELNVGGYEIYRSTDGGQTFTRKGFADPGLCMFTDDVFLLGTGATLHYYITAVNEINEPSPPSDTVTAVTRIMNDEELLDMVQEAHFRYFWDFAHPQSGMARERNNSGHIVTTGGSGFGVMAILSGIHRGFITRAEGSERMLKILGFLETADRFHGAWPHWLNGSSGKVVPFSTKDNGGDLVETAFMVQGLLAARSFFDQQNPTEQQIRGKITGLWETVEWDWYRKNGSNVLYWHWSPDYGWDINMQIRGWNECLIVYLLAIASPTHPVPASLWNTGWSGSTSYTNGGTFFGIPLAVGWNYGGPLFFAHYSFLGFDPRYKKDRYTNYFINNMHHAQINHAYCVNNPKNFTGYGENCWGLTASDDPDGYLAHEPYSRDNGTISPTAAIASFPYTPAESMKALKHFYRDRGERLWGNLGFIDAFNLKRNWYATSYLAIDQGPIVGMIENHRSGLLWQMFMANGEIDPALKAIGFLPDSANHVPDLQTAWPVAVYPNPVSHTLYIRSGREVSRAEITDLSGRPVRSITAANGRLEAVPVQDLPAGFYLVTVHSNRTTVVLRFVKMD